MPLDECSAAMGFQVGFKGVGFFFVFKGNRVFDTPWSEFRCMRHIAFIVFFQTGSQIFGTADVEMGSGGFINEYVNVVEVRHQAGIFQNNVCGSAVPCCPASSATADYAAAVFPSGFAHQSICCATGLPRRNLGFAEMKTGGRYKTRTCDLIRVKDAF